MVVEIVFLDLGAQMFGTTYMVVVALIVILIFQARILATTWDIVFISIRVGGCIRPILQFLQILRPHFAGMGSVMGERIVVLVLMTVDVGVARCVPITPVWLLLILQCHLQPRPLVRLFRLFQVVWV
jgi:hypothetical protein